MLNRARVGTPTKEPSRVLGTSQSGLSSLLVSALRGPQERSCVMLGLLHVSIPLKQGTVFLGYFGGPKAHKPTSLFLGRA